jgi:formylglycine-generating enzyme required for sulfatase activity
MKKLLVLGVAILLSSGCVSQPDPWVPDSHDDGKTDVGQNRADGTGDVRPGDMALPDAVEVVITKTDMVDAAVNDTVDVVAVLDLLDTIDGVDGVECVPQCVEVECGDDGCGGSCGDCGQYLVCAAGTCHPNFCKDGLKDFGCCAGNVWLWCDDGGGLKGYNCGDNDAPLDTCGWDSGKYECGGDGEDPEGKFPLECCESDCSNKDCGTDGCWGDCGSCAEWKTCTDGYCSCTPDCAGKECGPDGCDGVCGDCDDDNLCTDDSCDADTGDCVFAPNLSGCDDGDLCTVDDVCQDEGKCDGVPVDCFSLDAPCMYPVCNPLTGDCGIPVKDGIACGDDNSCNGVDSCLGGECVTGPVVECPDDGNPCTVDECDQVTGTCHAPLSDGMDCDDGDLCNGVMTCVEGVCMDSGAVIICPAPDKCHEPGICEPATGVCSNPPKDDGEGCDDGDACTDFDQCLSGLCTPAGPNPCDDGSDCTDTSCDPGVGCLYSPVEDGTPCGDEDGWVCEVGICLQLTPPCLHPPVAEDCDNGWCIVPAGCRVLGSPEDEPWRNDDEEQHEVTLTRGFLVGQTEVTQDEFLAVMEYNPSEFHSCGGDCPVDHVSWYEALKYANLLSAESGLPQCFDCSGVLPDFVCELKATYSNPQECPGYRLLTEAEWEYAARAGTTTAFYSGPITVKSQYAGAQLDPALDEIGWYVANCEVSYPGCHNGSQNSGFACMGSHPAASKEANAWGLSDMSGNLAEMVWDRYGQYPEQPVVDPMGPLEGSNHVVRGGQIWSSATGCRSAHRNQDPPDHRTLDIGFRVVRSCMCEGKQCGDDGCGGSCGDCGEGYSCNDSHVCTMTDEFGLTWVGIPGGTFLMGCSPGDDLCDGDELPAHSVTLEGFLMMDAEATESQFVSLMFEDPSCDENGGGGADSPVDCVTWTKAQAFCSAVGGRLPTEAEWEYAARGGTTTSLYCGEDSSCLGDIAWYYGNSDQHKHNVKEKLPNQFGLFDILGNVYEWTADWYDPDYYDALPVDDPQGPGSGSSRVRRGCSFLYKTADVRVSERLGGEPDNKYYNVGFRCAKDSCVPNCAKKECGYDGCGGVCGECLPGHDCDSGTCTTSGFIQIEAGSFWMGSPGGEGCPVGYTGGGCNGDGSGTTWVEPGRNAEEPLHPVTLTVDFEMQEHELTQGEWKAAFGGWNPSTSTIGNSYPVETVSWFDSLVYANWKSVQEGYAPCYAFTGVQCEQGGNPPGGTDAKFCLDAEHGGVNTAAVTLAGVASKPQECEGYRLPTDAEWELAARAGTLSAYHNGQGSESGHLECEVPFHLTEIAWYCGNNSPSGTKAVGGKAANSWGLKDMSGNVHEWCWDMYCSDTTGYGADPDGSSCGGSNRVFRGGVWLSPAHGCRSAERRFIWPDYSDNNLGFRLVRSL